MTEPGRIALVVAAYPAVAPPGVSPAAFAAAALADTYEVLAAMEGVTAGIVGGPEHDDLLWPGSVRVEAGTVRGVADQVVAGEVVAGHDPLFNTPLNTLVLVPADLPDLPQLVIAKVLKALIRGEVCLAPERGGDGLAALGVRLPWPPWLPEDLSLDHDPYAELIDRVPDRRRLTKAADWRRLRTPAATDRLDPGLEGWEETRALLAGRPLTPGPRAREAGEPG